MAFGGRQVDEAAFAQQVDLASVFQRVLFDEGAGGALGGRHVLEGGDVDFDVEVAGVRNNRSVLHQREVIFGEHTLVAGYGAEHVAAFGGFVHAHDAKAVHDGLERFGGIDFGDDDFCSGAAGAGSKSAAAPAVAGDHELRTRQQEIRGADDAVDGGLSRPITVIEKMLGVGVVDGDDGELEDAFLGHGAQADDAGGGLFGSSDHVGEPVGALGMQKRDQVGAVVHGDVGLVVDGGEDMVVVSIVVFALDGEDGNVMVADEAGSHVILRGQWVRGAKHHVGSAVAQADREIRGLRRNVQAGRNADALQWLILDEFLADNLQHFHGLVRPLNALLSQVGQFYVLDVAIHSCG